MTRQPSGEPGPNVPENRGPWSVARALAAPAHHGGTPRTRTAGPREDRKGADGPHSSVLQAQLDQLDAHPSSERMSASRALEFPLPWPESTTCGPRSVPTGPAWWRAVLRARTPSDCSAQTRSVVGQQEMAVGKKRLTYERSVQTTPILQWVSTTLSGLSCAGANLSPRSHHLGPACSSGCGRSRSQGRRTTTPASPTERTCEAVRDSGSFPAPGITGRQGAICRQRVATSPQRVVTQTAPAPTGARDLQPSAGMAGLA
jgi:hypothetical protein